MHFRVKFIALNGTLQQAIKACVIKDQIDFPKMNLFLNGAQLMSYGFKKDLMEVFKGAPLVSSHSRTNHF